MPCPLSPDEAKKVTPVTWKWESLLTSLEDSPPPQLMETWWTPVWEAAKSTAPKRLAKLFVAASTKRILAPGAMAWAHSTSRDISRAQPRLVLGGPWGV